MREKIVPPKNLLGTWHKLRSPVAEDCYCFQPMRLFKLPALLPYPMAPDGKIAIFADSA